MRNTLILPYHHRTLTLAAGSLSVPPLARRQHRGLVRGIPSGYGGYGIWEQVTLLSEAVREKYGVGKGIFINGPA